MPGFPASLSTTFYYHLEVCVKKSSGKGWFGVKEEGVSGGKREGYPSLHLRSWVSARLVCSGLY